MKFFLIPFVYCLYITSSCSIDQYVFVLFCFTYDFQRTLRNFKNAYTSVGNTFNFFASFLENRTGFFKSVWKRREPPLWTATWQRAPIIARQSRFQAIGQSGVTHDIINAAVRRFRLCMYAEELVWCPTDATAAVLPAAYSVYNTCATVRPYKRVYSVYAHGACVPILTDAPVIRVAATTVGAPEQRILLMCVRVLCVIVSAVVYYIITDDASTVRCTARRVRLPVYISLLRFI